MALVCQLRLLMSWRLARNWDGALRLVRGPCRLVQAVLKAFYNSASLGWHPGLILRGLRQPKSGMVWLLILSVLANAAKRNLLA